VSGVATARNRAVALAAVLECAILVDQLARTGTAPADEMRALSESLFRLDWERAEDVYGGPTPLARGLERVDALLSETGSAGRGNVTRYALSLLYLGKRLSRDRERLAVIRSRLGHAGLKSEHFATSYDELAASLAAIYQDTISTYRYRIQVSGSAEHLQDNRVAARIRALLLAGVRAAVLWRHCGGSRLDLLLDRRRLRQATRELRGDA